MINKRLDRIEKQLDSINDRLIEYNTQLAIHIEGVIQNRTHIAKIEKELDEVVGHVHEVQGVGKAFKWTAAAVAFCLSLGGLLKMLGVI